MGNTEWKSGVRRLIRILLFMSFGIYALVLLYLLLLMHGGRGYGFGMTIGEYIRSCTNFIPFKSIILYIRGSATIA